MFKFGIKSAISSIDRPCVQILFHEHTPFKEIVICEILRFLEKVKLSGAMFVYTGSRDPTVAI